MSVTEKFGKEVKTSPVDAENDFILRIEGTDQLDAAKWATENKPALDESLLVHGAIFLTGFGITPTDFPQVASAMSPNEKSLEYTGGTSPRPKVSEGVYLSTTYPAGATMVQHHEMTYFREWPLKVFFYAENPSPIGGETPLCSSRVFMSKLDPQIVNEFAKREVQYIRNYGMTGPNWEQSFQTDNRSEVETFCNNKGIEWEWRPENRLRTRHTAQGIANHPTTGEKLWCNQAHALSSHSGVRGLRSSTLKLFAPGFSEELIQGIVDGDPLDAPHFTRYGDGGLIDPSIIDEVNHLLESEKTTIKWQQGDLMILDNMLASHGRNPYQGERRILATLTELYRPTGISNGSQKPAARHSAQPN